MSKQASAVSSQAIKVIEQLHPQLTELERERKELSDRTRRLLIIIVVASLIGAMLVRLIMGSGWSGVAILILIAGAVLAVWQLVHRQKQWEQRVLDNVLPVICKSLGEVRYQPNASVKEFLPAFQKLGVIGTADKCRLPHHFSGRHEGIGFEFADAVLEDKSRSSRGSSRVFQGLLFRIQVPWSVDQRLLISPRVSIKLLNKRADMTEVSLNDSLFDETLVVHHESNQLDGAALADRILTPEFRQGLLELNRQEGKRAHDMGAFVIGMMYDSMYMAMSRYQSSGAIGKIQIERPVPFLDVRFFMRSDARLDERVGAMVEDVATVYRVIDRLPLAG